MRFPTEPNGDYHWAISPNGLQIAYLKEHWNADQIHFIPLHGGDPRTITLRGHFLLSSLDWTPDSKSMFIATESANGSTLLHVDLKGNVQPVWQQTESGSIWGIPSPDGHHIAMQGTTSNANVWMIDNF